jgi:hypothetical protein
MNVMNLLYWFQEERPVYVAVMTGRDGYTFKEAVIKVIDHPDPGVTFVTIMTEGVELRLKPDEIFDNPKDAIEHAIQLVVRHRARAVCQAMAPYDKNIERLKVKMREFQPEEGLVVE